MKRYFLARDAHMPALHEDWGQHHFIDLVSHGPAGDKWNLICLADVHVLPHPQWVPFPPVYDNATTLEASAVPHECLIDLGLTGAETCLQAVMRLGEIHPLMGF